MSRPPHPSSPLSDPSAPSLLSRLNRSGAVDRLRKAVESRLTAADASRLSQVHAATTTFLHQSTERAPAALLSRAKDAVLTPAIPAAVRADVAKATAQGHWFDHMMRAELGGLDALCEAATFIDAAANSASPPPPANDHDSGHRLLQKIIGNATAAVRKPPSGKTAPKRPAAPKNPADHPADARTPIPDPHKDPKRTRPRGRLPPTPAPSAAQKSTEFSTSATGSPESPDAAKPAPERTQLDDVKPCKPASRDRGAAAEEDSTPRVSSQHALQPRKGNLSVGSGHAQKAERGRCEVSTGKALIANMDVRADDVEKKPTMAQTNSARRTAFAEMAADLRKLATSENSWEDHSLSDKPDTESKLLQIAAGADLAVRMDFMIGDSSPKEGRTDEMANGRLSEAQGLSLSNNADMEMSQVVKTAHDPRSSTIDRPKRPRRRINVNVEGPEASSALGNSEDEQLHVKTAEDQGLQLEEKGSKNDFMACGDVKKARRAMPRDNMATGGRAFRSHPGDATARTRRNLLKNSGGMSTKSKLELKNKAQGLDGDSKDLNKANAAKDLRSPLKESIKAELELEAKAKLVLDGSSNDSMEVDGRNSNDTLIPTYSSLSRAQQEETSKPVMRLKSDSSPQGVSNPEKDTKKLEVVGDEESTVAPKLEIKSPHGQPREYKGPESSDRDVANSSPDSLDQILTEGLPKKCIQSRGDKGKQRKTKKRRRGKEESELSSSSEQHRKVAKDLDNARPSSAKRSRIQHTSNDVCVPEDYEKQQQILCALHELMEKEYAEPFLEPVDQYDEGCRTYYEEIKNPMDLGTISKRLQESTPKLGFYINCKAILADIELVWSNCTQFNGLFDPICVDLQKCTLFWGSLLEKNSIDCTKDIGAQRRRPRVKSIKRKIDEEVSSKGVKSSNPRKKAKSNDINDGRLVGKAVTVFAPHGPKKVKAWMEVKVIDFNKRSKSYTLKWVESGKKTVNATFGNGKMFPVFQP